MKLPKKINWFLLIFPVLIFSLGFVTLFSTNLQLATNQLVFFVLGVAVYAFVSLVDYRLWGYYWRQLYFVGLIVLLMTYFVGHEVFGSSRWLQIGPFTLQPSEFAKIITLITVSYFISRGDRGIKEVKEVLRIAAFVIPLVLLVLIQPDLGTSIVILLIFVGCLWFGGLKKIYFFIGALFLGIFSSPFWNLLKDYQKERILVFLNPTLDTLGSGYNVIQSTIAVGSGGLFGRGFGRGTQSHLQFLPVFWTDFIFASFAEEWGFIGVLVLLLIYAAFLVSVLVVGLRTKESFGSVIAVGVFVVFFFQFLVNVGMNLGLMPVTGIPLPLVSYGGSSLLTSAFLLGLVQSVWIHERA